MELDHLDDPTPTHPRPSLASIGDVRLELARVYRSMKAGDLAMADGSRLTYVLVSIGKLIEVHEIERRVMALEDAQKRIER